MTPDKQIDAQEFINSMPQSRALGLEVEIMQAGVAVVHLPYSKNLVGDPKTGVVHGGAVSTLMDTCSGASVMCHPDSPAMTSTLDLRIDYMRSATPGQTIVARAECYHITKSIAFVRATACDDDTDNPVACATGAFTVAGA